MVVSIAKKIKWCKHNILIYGIKSLQTPFICLLFAQKRMPIAYVINQFTGGNILIKLYLHIIITFNSPSVQGY